jgi:site-specific recombinase XerC
MYFDIRYMHTTYPVLLAEADLLLPEVLASSAEEAVREILEESAAANTTRSYGSALRYWAAWFRARYGQDIRLPVPSPVVVQFVVDHVARRTQNGLAHELPQELDVYLVRAGIKQRPGPLRLSTVIHRVAVLSKAHQLRKLPSPAEDPGVRHLLGRSRRAAHKRGERPRKKTAITAADLNAVVATCDDSMEGMRDRALLLFAFASGGRRRSECAAAHVDQLRKVGPGQYVFRLEHSKTQQTGPSAASTPDKPVIGSAGVALARWLEASGIKDGPIFRRLWSDRLGPALSPQAVAQIIQRRAKLAGLKGDFGGHSLRSGFVTEGGRRGVSLPALMAMTEHRSVASVVGYFQAGGVLDNPAANLVDVEIGCMNPLRTPAPSRGDSMHDL